MNILAYVLQRPFRKASAMSLQVCPATTLNDKMESACHIPDNQEDHPCLRYKDTYERANAHCSSTNLLSSYTRIETRMRYRAAPTMNVASTQSFG